VGVGEPTGRVDVYATGVLLFRVLTGRFPFEGESAHAIMDQHVRTPAPDVRVYASEVPEELVRLVARCLVKQPTERPRAMDIARELANWADAAGAPPLWELSGQTMPSSVDINLESRATASPGETATRRQG
jgi:serine/threonine-protein kinase